MPSHLDRAEIIARVLYRHWMEDDFDEFPWDDENEPSNETVEEARDLAVEIDAALTEQFPLAAEFELAVDNAARERLQTLVRALDNG